MLKRNTKPCRKHKKKEKYPFDNPVYTRERKLKRMIKEFKRSCKRLPEPPTMSEYNKMNKQQKDIRSLFNLQNLELWNQSVKRKEKYYKQLDEFNQYYTLWKRKTCFLYYQKKYRNRKVRIKEVKKLNNKSILGQIAKWDPDAEVRKTAQDRLKEL